MLLTHKNKVCKLNKSLYGLKQSAMCWNLVINDFLKDSRYIQSTADLCIYYRSEVVSGRRVVMIIAVYADDKILPSNDIFTLNAEMERLSSHFEIDDGGGGGGGGLHYVLGMTIRRNWNLKLLTIDQNVYLQNVLKRFGIEDCKPISTPLESGKRFEALGDEDPADITEYQAVISSLTYAMIATRPDLSVSVGMLSQFMNKPGKEHWIGP